jgi:hypothetical protein
MIKLTNILDEITVNAPKKLEYKKIIRDYIRDGSKGSLDLSNLNEKIKLPDNLKAGGSLDLGHTQITSLPDNLQVRGSLYLYDTQITSLPDNLQVGGNLSLYDTPITSLPDNLKVGGNLDLENTPLSQNHTREEIRQMIEDKGGFIRGNIYI